MAGRHTHTHTHTQIYPVKLTENAICIDVSGAQTAARGIKDRGGAFTSIENNNVFSVRTMIRVTPSPLLLMCGTRPRGGGAHMCMGADLH